MEKVQAAAGREGRGREGGGERSRTRGRRHLLTAEPFIDKVACEAERTAAGHTHTHTQHPLLTHTHTHF